jgi:hypothetical protein
VANDLHLFHITCGGCTAGWAGEDQAHCGHCHVTYDSITFYDAPARAGAASDLRCWASSVDRSWSRPALHSTTSSVPEASI